MRNVKVLLLLIGIISFAACKGKEAGTSASAGKIPLRFTHWDGGSTLEVYDQMVRDFNQSQDKIEVTILNMPTDYATKITAMVASGDTPEFSMLDTGDVMYPFAEEGHVANIAELAKNDPNFDPSYLNDYSLYWADPTFLVGIAVGAEMIGLFYSPALFAKYGVPEPPARYADAWDWDTFVNVAQRLTIDAKGNNALSKDFDPENIAIYGVTFGKWHAIYFPFVFSAGGEALSKDGKEFGLFSPEGIDVMQKLGDLINKYHVSPTPTATSTLPGASEAFLSGKVAMAIEGHWINADLMMDDVPYDVAALPKIKTPKSEITAGVMCIMNTPRKESAWEFFKFISQTGRAKPLEVSGLWLPSTKDGYSESYLKSIITDKHPRHYYEAFLEPMIDGTAQRFVPGYVKNWPKINNDFSAILDPLWYGEKTYIELVNENKDLINASVQGFRSPGKL
ncbi:ABC transporter substrate-binding protein [Spirochaetia bacterium]|nr:ABC transporter substrate-binding protein [Spirochaetia bacterium]